MRQLEKARAVWEAKRKYDEVRTKLAAFPPALANMTGQEIEALQEICSNLAQKRQEKATAEDRLRSISAELAQLGLPQDGIPTELLATWRKQVARLKRLRETEIPAKTQELDKASAELDQLRQLLGDWVQQAQTSFLSLITLAEV